MKQVVFIYMAFVISSCATAQQVLVFSKTMGFRHASIETGVETIKELGKENGFQVDHTEDSLKFTLDHLKTYDLVIFLNTTKNVLDDQQQESFKSYMNDGGSFMGIHAAADTEYDWPWYGKMVGAYFKSHPEQQEAQMDVVVLDHPSTSHLPKRWKHFDEWYNYSTINPDIHVLINLDESSYKGGENGANHPIAWFHEYGGGRVFYTGLGHTKEAYQDENFRNHLLGGINYCLNK